MKKNPAGSQQNHHETTNICVQNQLTPTHEQIRCPLSFISYVMCIAFMYYSLTLNQSVQMEIIFSVKTNLYKLT